MPWNLTLCVIWVLYESVGPCGGGLYNVTGFSVMCMIGAGYGVMRRYMAQS